MTIAVYGNRIHNMVVAMYLRIVAKRKGMIKNDEGK